MNLKSGYVTALVATMLSLFSTAAWAQSGSWVLPSSAFRAGQNGAEFHTDVRIMNLGTSQVTVTATLYDQDSGTTVPAPGFPVAGRSQASFDNILQSLFGKTLSQGAYGPIRFDSTGPIIVSASVNNVNACGTGATSGTWLPGISASEATTGGAIAQLAASSNGATGYRTNLVVMNPGTTSVTTTMKVRTGGGALLSTGTIGPLGANGFSQVALDSPGTFPGVAGRTDTNLWVEFTSNQPVLAFASVINNASGDPFAVVATADAFGEVPTPGSWDGTWSGRNGNNYTVSFDVVSNHVVKVIYGGNVSTYSSSTSCGFNTFFTPQPGYAVGSNGSFTFNVPPGAGSIGITGTANLTTTGSGTGLYNYNVSANTVPGSPLCSGTGSATFSVTHRVPAPAHQSWDGTWSGRNDNNYTVSFDVVNNQVVKVIYGGNVSTSSSSTSCGFNTFFTPQPGYAVDGNGSFTFNDPAASGSIGITATGNLTTTGNGTGLYAYDVSANSVPGSPSCNGTGAATFSVTRVGGPPPHP